MSTPTAQPEATPIERVGAVVGQRYKLLSLLGEGGMGMVYLAEDLKAGGRVALKMLKMLKRDVANDELVLARFEREAVAMQALAHEHIVAALGFGRSPEGDMCLVMEHIEGETLRTMLKRVNQVPVPGVLEIARQIALALVRAHGLGVVHRDLKPENVMVTWAADGKPRTLLVERNRWVGGQGDDGYHLGGERVPEPFWSDPGTAAEAVPGGRETPEQSQRAEWTIIELLALRRASRSWPCSRRWRGGRRSHVVCVLDARVFAPRHRGEGLRASRPSFHADSRTTFGISNGCARAV